MTKGTDSVLGPNFHILRTPANCSRLVVGVDPEAPVRFAVVVVNVAVGEKTPLPTVAEFCGSPASSSEVVFTEHVINAG